MSTHDHDSHMDCSQALYRMMQYVDGELQPGDAELIATHLTTCAPCLAEHDMDQMVKALVQRSCHEDPAPPRLRTTILQSMQTWGADGTYTEVTRRITYEE